MTAHSSRSISRGWGLRFGGMMGLTSAHAPYCCVSVIMEEGGGEESMRLAAVEAEELRESPRDAEERTEEAFVLLVDWFVRRDEGPA